MDDHDEVLVVQGMLLAAVHDEMRKLMTVGCPSRALLMAMAAAGSKLVGEATDVMGATDVAKLNLAIDTFLASAIAHLYDHLGPENTTPQLVEDYMRDRLVLAHTSFLAANQGTDLPPHADDVERPKL